MPPKNMGEAEVGYLKARLPEERRMGRDTPTCACGHDIFYHDIQVGQMTPPGEPQEVKVGQCRADECKCKRYYGTNEWFNALWEKFKRFQR